MIRKSTNKNSMGKIKHNITTIDDIKFHSKLESKYYEKLKEDKLNNKIKDFKLQPQFILQDKYIIVDGQVIEGENPEFNKIKRKTKAATIRAIVYIGDFLITELDGTQRVVDTKGLSTPDFEIKKKLFMFKYPNLKLEVITYNSKTKEWQDFYEYNKEKRARKKAKKSSTI